MVNVFGYLRKLHCLSKALSYLFRLGLIYLKTVMTSHSYGLPEKPHRIDENAFVFGTGYFSN